MRNSAKQPSRFSRSECTNQLVLLFTRSLAHVYVEIRECLVCISLWRESEGHSSRSLETFVMRNINSCTSLPLLANDQVCLELYMSNIHTRRVPNTAHINFYSRAFQHTYLIMEYDKQRALGQLCNLIKLQTHTHYI